METVTNVVNAAAHAIWGDSANSANSTNTKSTTSTVDKDASTQQHGEEPVSGAHSGISKGSLDNTTASTTGITEEQLSQQHGEEPLSGFQGNTAKGEPFDKGNIEAPSAEQHGKEPLSGVQGDTAKDESFDMGNVESSLPEIAVITPITGADEAATAQDGPVNESSSNDMPTVTPRDFATSSEPVESETTRDSAHSDVSFSKNTGTAPAPDTSSSTGEHDISSSTPGAGAVQNDTRSPSDPATHPANEPSSDVDNTGKGPNPTESNLDDSKSPRPVAEVAKVHHGDAGRTEGGEGANADEGENEEIMEDEKDKGTGEKWVKSSGVQAEGGDFDVTKPGAGREAERLMDPGHPVEGGAHDQSNKESSESNRSSIESQDSGKGSGANNGSKRMSLKAKLKKKLHIHQHHDEAEAVET